MSERSLFGSGEVHQPPEPELPPIQGTPNQIKWATDVRNGKINHCRKALRDIQALTEQYRRQGKTELYESHRARLRKWMDRLEQLEANTSARFFLDRRENSASELLNDEDAKPGSTY
jgi:hypothetical protein